MLDTIRTFRRDGRTWVTDGDRTYPQVAGGAGDDEGDDTTDRDDATGDENDDEDDDEGDPDALGDAGKRALDALRDEVKDLKKDKRKLRRDLRQARNRDTDSDTSSDDDTTDDNARVEIARERAQVRAERFALRADVDPDRIDRFMKLVDVSTAVDADGTIDNDELKAIIDDEVDAWPEFVTTTQTSTDSDATSDNGDPEAGGRKPNPTPLGDRVESRLESIEKRTGIQLASK